MEPLNENDVEMLREQVDECNIYLWKFTEEVKSEELSKSQKNKIIKFIDFLTLLDSVAVQPGVDPRCHSHLMILRSRAKTLLEKDKWIKRHCDAWQKRKHLEED